MKKKLIIIGILVLLIIGVLLFSKTAKNAVKDSSKIIVGQKTSYQDYIEKTGNIEPKNINRYAYNGLLVQAYVNQGEKVTKGMRLVEVNQGEENKVIKANSDGLVYELTDGYIAIGSVEGEVSFLLSDKEKEKVAVSSSFSIGDNSGSIRFISQVASIVDDQVYYQAIGDFNGDFQLNEKVIIHIPTQEYQDAYLVPLNSVIKSGQKSYIFFPSFLKHPTNYDQDDYQEVKVINTQGNMLVITDYQGEEIIEFDGLSLAYVNELMK